MSNFACTACGFEFSLDLPAGAAGCRCPMCGETAESVELVTSSAAAGGWESNQLAGDSHRTVARTPVLPAAFTASAPLPVSSPVAESAAAPPAAEEEDAELVEHGMGWLQMHVSFLTSVCVHTVMLLVLALVVVPRQVRSPIAFELSSDPSDSSLAGAFEIMPALELPSAAPLEPSYDFTESETAEVELDQPAPEEAPEGLPNLDYLLQSTAGQSGGAGLGGGLGSGGSEAYGEIAGRVAREGGASGDVQISLAWDNFNDLDLHVICPSGEEIFYQHTRSRCGGKLDVDMNAGGRQSREPVENIVWPQGEAPRGEYRVLVHYYGSHGDPDPTRFRVAVRVGGQVKVFEGQLNDGQPKKHIHTFNVDSLLAPSSPSGGDFPL